MNVLINFSTLKCGGGQNVALNFLSVFPQIVENGDKHCFFLVAKGSSVHRWFEKNGNYKYFVCPRNPVQRLLFEICITRSIIKKYQIDIIYSYFGYGLFPKKIPQISGAADSNLLFPEIDFWGDYKGIRRWKHLLIDQYRIYGLKHARGIIFENECLEKRFQELYKLNTLTITIKPSISNIYNQEFFRLPSNIIGLKKGLFLCGWHLNKNVLLIPEIAYNFKLMSYPFHLLLTAPLDNSKIYRDFIKLVELYDVQEYISIIGPVKKEELASLYQQVDVVYLLSKLESFSNNIIEAWTYKKPLIISNEEWAHSICSEGAIYVDRNSARDIANVTLGLCENQNYREKIVNNGFKQLQTYPSIQDKTKQEWNFINRIYENV
ncbi:MAG: glycosyltransferase [Bacteroidales bacterium]|nr:glycosyltransferase [Bacteroidales bacterium]